MNDRETERERLERLTTPIIDGDARPDINLDAGSDRVDEAAQAILKESKFESERRSDVNSLEDFRDANE